MNILKKIHPLGAIFALIRLLLRIGMAVSIATPSDNAFSFIMWVVHIVLDLMGSFFMIIWYIILGAQEGTNIGVNTISHIFMTIYACIISIPMWYIFGSTFLKKELKISETIIAINCLLGIVVCLSITVFFKLFLLARDFF